MSVWRPAAEVRVLALAAIWLLSERMAEVDPGALAAALRQTGWAGWLGGVTLNAIARALVPSGSGVEPDTLQLFYVEGWFAALVLGASTLVAVVAGFYPAWRAAKLDPVVALRRE